MSVSAHSELQKISNADIHFKPSTSLRSDAEDFLGLHVQLRVRARNQPGDYIAISNSSEPASTKKYFGLVTFFDPRIR